MTRRAAARLWRAFNSVVRVLMSLRSARATIDSTSRWRASAAQKLGAIWSNAVSSAAPPVHIQDHFLKRGLKQ